MRDFMSLIFTKQTKIQLQQKKNRVIYEVTFIDDAVLNYDQRVVNHKTEDTQLQIKPHVWEIQFDIMLTDKHDVVLELLWLHDINLKICF